MDELARLVGADPVAFRLVHLDDPRGRAVIQAVAAASGWDADELGGAGRGRGIGFARYKNMGAYCAVAARVKMDKAVRLISVHTAVDCGAVVHRDGVVNQIEGGVFQAASWTLKEQVRFDREGILTCDWESYPILGFRDCPDIAVEVLDRPELPSLGAGECAAGPTAAAIGNAVAHALGIRVRYMPITPERIIAAMND